MHVMKDLIYAVQNEIDKGKTTIAQLAMETGCSRQYVYNLLKGKSDPTMAVAERLAATVGFSLVLRKSTNKSQKITA